MADRRSHAVGCGRLLSPSRLSVLRGSQVRRRMYGPDSTLAIPVLIGFLRRRSADVAVDGLLARQRICIGHLPLVVSWPGGTPDCGPGRAVFDGAGSPRCRARS